VLAAPCGRAEDKPEPIPKVTALVPLSVPQGFSGTVRMRGVKLKEATEVRADGSTPPDKIGIKEIKDAGTPAGMEKDPLGESEVILDLRLAADFPLGPIPLSAMVGGRSTAPVLLQVLPSAQLQEEKEPNNGFSSAMKLELGQRVNGLINGQRDVDVFTLAGKAGQALKVSVTAHAAASLLDPLLSVYDAAGQQLAAKDDVSLGGKDTALIVTPMADGPVFLVLQDALDFGSEWHSYRLDVEVSESSKPASGVSFSRDVWPILRANCASCHRPSKLKGQLDLTSMAALIRGGENGEVVKKGAPADSSLIAVVSGDEPEMPPEGAPLSAAEVALLERWISEGAVDDTPVDGLGTRRPEQSPRYHALPAVPALAFSPDGSILAVAGHHEIIVHRGDGSAITGRWLGNSPRIESLAFSRDGKFLAAGGGAPSEFGEIQLWDVAAGTLVRSIRAGSDTLYGVSWSDDGTRLAVGGADKLVRAFDAASGARLMQCDNHLDWVFGTAFAHDGSKLISISRDRGVKLIDMASGHLIDDAARPREPVLALARHPLEDLVAFTGTEGKVRLHRMAPRGGRLKEGDDKEESAVREFEHMATPLYAVALSADGTRLACGGQNGEIRLFLTESGKREATIPSSGGPIFTLAFHPQEHYLAAAGSDGQVRFYNATDGHLMKSFGAVPLGVLGALEVPAPAVK
jgi:WD40 repeat protein